MDWLTSGSLWKDFNTSMSASVASQNSKVASRAVQGLGRTAGGAGRPSQSVELAHSVTHGIVKRA